MFGLRLGTDPRVVVTTTPRPTRLLRELIVDPTVAVTPEPPTRTAQTSPPPSSGKSCCKYEGTRLGRQELEAEILEDVPGALWNHGMIETARAAHRPCTLCGWWSQSIRPRLPATGPDETGIIVAGKDEVGRGWVLADASGRYQPNRMGEDCDFSLSRP